MRTAAQLLVPPALFLALVAACGRSEPATAEADAPAPTRAAATAPFPVQPGWVEEPPSSSMRVAQFRLPGEAGAKDAELAVFAFPGGGSVESNFERWCGQFEQADGSSPRAAARTSREERDGLTVHRIEVGGTYVAETTPGSGVRLNEPRWRLIGAVIEGPQGMHFVKATGPDATLERWRSSVDAFLAAARP
jgi:hypothetical protein